MAQSLGWLAAIQMPKVQIPPLLIPFFAKNPTYILLYPLRLNFYKAWHNPAVNQIRNITTFNRLMQVTNAVSMTVLKTLPNPHYFL